MSTHSDPDIQTNPWEDGSIQARSALPASTPSILSQANGVEILGSSVATAGGNIVTINHGLLIPQDRPPLSPQTSSSRASSNSLSTTLLRPSTSQLPIHDSEVYAKNLLPRKHGYPLWIPQPPGDLPPEYTQNGLSIGDVGIITPDGQFDFLFNVFLPADDPINGGLVPEDFVPLSLGTRDVRFNEPAWDENTCVASHLIENQKIYTQSTCSSYVFTCTSTTGAILALPKGAFRWDLRNVNAVSSYALDHALTWYEFMNQVRGWNAPNGSLYIITGCDKTTLWGNASFSCGAKTHNSFDLRYTREMLDQSPSNDENQAYFWEQTIFASTKSNPRHPISRSPNQCVFLRGFKIRVRESLWDALTSPVTVKDVSTCKPNTILSKSKYIPFGGAEKPSKPKLARKLSVKGQAEGAADDQPLEPDATIVDDSSSSNEVPHPSDLINKYLLSAHENVKVAITHDEVWMSLLEEGENLVPEVGELIGRMNEHWKVVCSGDGIYPAVNDMDTQLEGPAEAPNEETEDQAADKTSPEAQPPVANSGEMAPPPTYDSDVASRPNPARPQSSAASRAESPIREIEIIRAPKRPPSIYKYSPLVTSPTPASEEFPEVRPPRRVLVKSAARRILWRVFHPRSRRLN